MMRSFAQAWNRTKASKLSASIGQPSVLGEGSRCRSEPLDSSCAHPWAETGGVPARLQQQLHPAALPAVGLQELEHALVGVRRGSPPGPTTPCWGRGNRPPTLRRVASARRATSAAVHTSIPGNRPRYSRASAGGHCGERFIAGAFARPSATSRPPTSRPNGWNAIGERRHLAGLGWQERGLRGRGPVRRGSGRRR